MIYSRLFLKSLSIVLGAIERLRKSWFTGACKSSMSHQSQSSSPQLGVNCFLILKIDFVILVKRI